MSNFEKFDERIPAFGTPVLELQAINTFYQYDLLQEIRRRIDSKLILLDNHLDYLNFLRQFNS